jgi:ATP synthase regulation protein NCA2
MEHALEALDRLMRANNLLFRLLAAIPSLVLAQVLFQLVKRLVLPGPAPPPVVHKRLRAGLLAVEHCLVRCAPHHLDPLSTGRILCVLFHLHQLAESLPVQEQVLFRRHISDLSSPAFDVSQRLAAIQRMHNAHYFLAPQPSRLWQY